MAPYFVLPRPIWDCDYYRFRLLNIPYCKTSFKSCRPAYFLWIYWYDFLGSYRLSAVYVAADIITIPPIMLMLPFGNAEASLFAVLNNRLTVSSSSIWNFDLRRLSVWSQFSEIGSFQILKNSIKVEFEVDLCKTLKTDAIFNSGEKFWDGMLVRRVNFLLRFDRWRGNMKFNNIKRRSRLRLENVRLMLYQY